MQNFTLLGTVDVLPLQLDLQRHPELWNQHTGRTAHEGSPHAQVSDIWLRWRPEEQLKEAANYNEPFAEFCWYPAMAQLPSVRRILMDTMTRIGGTALGGTLITRIPPGCQVKPHTDQDGWHASYYRTKVYCVIRTNPRAVNITGGEAYTPNVGDVFSFDNLLTHAVINDGDTDRVTMMMALRAD